MSSMTTIATWQHAIAEFVAEEFAEIPADETAPVREALLADVVDNAREALTLDDEGPVAVADLNDSAILWALDGHRSVSRRDFVWFSVSQATMDLLEQEAGRR